MSKLSLMDDNRRSLFEKDTPVTWQAKHIDYFLNLPFIGRVTIQELIKYFPNIEDWDKEHAKTLVSNKRSHEYLPEEIPNLNEFNDENVITYLDKDYPNLFNSMGDDKPLLLWYNGNLNIGESVAVIGSREVHPHSIEITKEFTLSAIDKGFNIVSGLALGCDTLGHMTAVKNSSKTTAILPGPLETITPSENKDLAIQIIENDGLLLSEYRPKSKIERRNFVERDRLQAGLSKGVFVAQSGIPGGTLHTVRYSLKYKRKLIVYNPEMDANQYKGNNKLINKPLPNEDFDYLNIKTEKTRKELRSKETLADFIITDTKSIKDTLENL